MLISQKPLTSILIKPAGPDCNLACGYCFYLSKSEMFGSNKSHRMDLNILEELIHQALDQDIELVTFIWQGGEPTLMGLDFYRQVIHFQEQYGNGQIIGNSFQTNGILIDNQWAQFFKKYNFLVGLSIDGPGHVHNYYRRKSNGQRTHQKVVNSANILLDNGVEVNALTVVNNYSVQYPEEIYTFHKQLGLTYMQFIPCIETDPTDQLQYAPFSVEPGTYGEFLCQLFDLWISDFVDGKPTTSIRYFDSLFYHYVDLEPPECTLNSFCGNYIVVEHNGDVYSCDFFVEPQWNLGNISEGKMIDMFNSEQQLRFGAEKANLPIICSQCNWLRYCRGGCTKDRIHNQQAGGLNYLCSAYQMFLEHADSRFKDLALVWQKEQDERSVAKSEGSLVQKIGRNDPCPCGSGEKYKKCCAH